MPHIATIVPDRLAAIEDLVRRRLPEAVHHQEEPLIQALLSPATDNALTTAIEEWFTDGCRLEDVKRVRDEFLRHDIESSQIAHVLGVHETTVWRTLEKGTGLTKHWDKLQATFRDELKDYRPTSPDDKFISGYCHTVNELGRRVCRILGIHFKSMTHADFCFLWHTLMDDTWREGKRRDDPDYLDRAAGFIHRKVQTQFPAAPPVTAEQIESIHREWGFWFRLVMFARPPRCASFSVQTLIAPQESLS